MLCYTLNDKGKEKFWVHPIPLSFFSTATILAVATAVTCSHLVRDTKNQSRNKHSYNLIAGLVRFIIYYEKMENYCLYQLVLTFLLGNHLARELGLGTLELEELLLGQYLREFLKVLDLDVTFLDTRAG